MRRPLRLLTAAATTAPGAGPKADALKPGDGALYADDFTGDEVGDFPKRMEFKAGALDG